MGCHIHPHIEVKVAGKWLHYSIPNLRRCYALFTRICGVRDFASVAAIALPRSLPKDITEITRIEWLFEGGHTPTWLDRLELNELIRWHEAYLESRKPGTGHTAQMEQWGYMTGNNFLECQGSNPPEYEDVRFICWFDN